MFRSLHRLVGVTAGILALAPTFVAADSPRNPFKVKDVPNPDGRDVQAFDKQVVLTGNMKDPNAAQWAKKQTPVMAGVLDGEWSSRWNNGGEGGWTSGTATIRTVRDRVYILYEDRGGKYLIDAKKKGKRLVGRYMNLGVETDSAPWVGLIVDNERIDGVWQHGRWDLRRRFSKKSQ